MAKRKDEPDMDKPEFQEMNGVEMVDPEDEGLEQALQQLPQNQACVQIFRIKETGGRPLYLEAVQPSMFSLEYVAGKFGGGRYIAHGKKTTGHIIKLPFEVDGEPIPVRRNGPGLGVTPAPELLQAVRASMAGERQEIEYADNGTESLTQVLIAMLKSNQTTETQMLERMKMYKDLFGGNTPPPQQPLEQIATWFQKGLEFSGGAKDEPVLLTVLKEFKEPISKAVDVVQLAIQNSKAAQPVRPPQPGGKPATAPGEIPPGVPINEENMSLLLIQELQAHMPSINKAAAKAAAPQTYAEFIVDQLDESFYAPLMEFLSRPDCLDLIAMRNDSVRKYAAWWIEFRKVLIAELHEVTSDDGTPSLQPSENPESTTIHPAAS